MIIDFKNIEKKIYSQNGEDGITEKLLELLYGKDCFEKFYVEFGVESGYECNTRILRENYGWNGLLMDGNHSNPHINLFQEFITRENIVGLFEKYKCPKLIHLLSVDIDGNDFYCLHEILKHYTCDIIICEYNASHLPFEDKVVVYDAFSSWQGTNYFGASLFAYYNLMNHFGYQLVYCESRGVNSFYVRKSLLPNLKPEKIENLYRKPNYGMERDGGHPQDRTERIYVSSDSIIGNS